LNKFREGRLSHELTQNGQKRIFMGEREVGRDLDAVLGEGTR